MFYGKHFASMYEGSMVGAGPVAFSVMGYVISKQQPDRRVGSQVELNPRLLAFIIGTTEEEIDKALKFLCAPDPGSRSPEQQGRRLVKLGQFAYQVVNGAKYLAIRDQAARQEQNREAKRRQRAKGTPLPGEDAFVRAAQNGDEEAMDRLSTP